MPATPKVGPPERRLDHAFAYVFLFLGALTMWAREAGAGILTLGSEQVPFVGCASDGQVGPIAAPRDNGTAPRVRRAEAPELAYYATADIGVLAPRGWHCFGFGGSSGVTLIVTPEAHIAKDFLKPNSAALTGPVVQISLANGGTSGRFEAAQVAARLFPSQSAFVRRVAAEGSMPIGSFPYGPYPNDAVRRLSKQIVEFRTPAHQDGMGTRSRLAANDDPIFGIAIMPVDQDHSVVVVDVRMPLVSKQAVATILDATKHQYEHRQT